MMVPRYHIQPPGHYNYGWVGDKDLQRSVSVRGLEVRCLFRENHWGPKHTGICLRNRANTELVVMLPGVKEHERSWKSRMGREAGKETWGPQDITAFDFNLVMALSRGALREGKMLGILTISTSVCECVYVFMSVWVCISMRESMCVCDCVYVCVVCFHTFSSFVLAIQHRRKGSFLSGRPTRNGSHWRVSHCWSFYPQRSHCLSWALMTTTGHSDSQG